MPEGKFHLPPRTVNERNIFGRDAINREIRDIEVILLGILVHDNHNTERSASHPADTSIYPAPISKLHFGVNDRTFQEGQNVLKTLADQSDAVATARSIECRDNGVCVYLEPAQETPIVALNGVEEAESVISKIKDQEAISASWADHELPAVVVLCAVSCTVRGPRASTLVTT